MFFAGSAIAIASSFMIHIYGRNEKISA